MIIGNEKNDEIINLMIKTTKEQRDLFADLVRSPIFGVNNKDEHLEILKRILKK